MMRPDNIAETLRQTLIDLTAPFVCRKSPQDLRLRALRLP